MTAGAGSIFPVFLASAPSARALLAYYRGSPTAHSACQTRNCAYLARVSGHAPVDVKVHDAVRGRVPWSSFAR